MNTKDMNYNFLIPLDVPQKLKICHNLIEKFLSLSKDMDKSIAFQYELLTPYQQRIYKLVESFADLEDKFYVAKLEYDKKRTRFLVLTPWIEEELETEFIKSGYVLTDINSERIVQIIENGNIEDLITVLERTCEVINDDIKSIYKRISKVMSEWKQISDRISENLKNFEYRGMKFISTRLRVKLTPIIQEMQEELKQPFNEDSISRNELQKQFEDIIQEAKDDVFGNLSEGELKLYQEIVGGIETSRVIQLLNDKNLQSNLIELINENKIEIKLVPKITEFY